MAITMGAGAGRPGEPDRVDPHAHDHGTPGFLARWFFSTNREDIGTLYVIFALISATIAIAVSILMGTELVEPGLQVFSGGQSWKTTIFFVVMPALIGGVGNGFVPFPIGVPDTAFPRLNNISF